MMKLQIGFQCRRFRMNYHDIKHDDMNNGSGLRVTLFVSGCDHYCL